MSLLLQSLLLLILAPSPGLSFLCFFEDGMSCFLKNPDESYKISCKGNASVFGMYAFEEYRLARGKFLTAMCIKIGNVNNCTDSGPVNEYGGFFDYQCPHGKAITSVKYSYSGTFKDGIFDIRCCTVKDRAIRSCERWSGSSGYYQYAQMVNSLKPNVVSKPAITAIYSRFITRELVTGDSYKTRGYDIEMCRV